MSESKKLEKNVDTPSSGAGRIPLIGAAIAAIAASACCVVPAVLALVGISGVGAAVLTPYRPLFLGVTAVLLGLGFYLSYRAPRAAAADAADSDSCGCPAPRTRRSGRSMLWLGAIAVAFFAAYPYIAGAGVRTEGRGDATQTAASERTVLDIDGMTCESCVPEIVDKLSAVSGVVKVNVAFGDATATIVYDPQQVRPDALASVVSEMSNYRATVATP